MKKILILMLALVLVFAFCACGNEVPEPQEPEDSVEDLSETDITETCGYMTFEEITAAGYYPTWMQPKTIVIYDENGVPKITDGSELTPEDLVGRPEFEDMPFAQFSAEMKIEPNTKAEYDLHGFIQNIYYLWPDGNYNLSPYQNSGLSDEQSSAEPVSSAANVYMTLEEMTEAGYYPQWMPQGTEIVYDKNGKATIIKGREFTPEEIEDRDDIKDLGFIRKSKDYRIIPNTKVEYGPHDFIQNIYFLWPDGSYNLSPYSKTENAEITYYADITEYEQEKGKTVLMNENQCHSIYWLTSGMTSGAKETSEPMGFPRYKITFTYVGEEHCVHIDANNIFTSTFLEGGNYICNSGQYNFSFAEKLFNEAG